MTTVGIVANPASGRDVRRLLANAGTSTIADKVTVVRRVVIGAVRSGADRLLVLPDPHGLARKALQTLHLDGVKVVEVEVPRTHDERETAAAVAQMRDLGADCLVVLGGDGTNRAVAKGWPDAPIVPVSTGTNNVFPFAIEPTIAGAAAARAPRGEPCKVVRVEIDGQDDDLALVDAVVLEGDHVGSSVPFDPKHLRFVVLAIAEPASVGISPIGGLVHPVGRDDDGGVAVRLGEGRPLDVPISPGHYVTVGVAGVQPLAEGEVVSVDGPCILAFDGDRRRTVPTGSSARFRVERTGPHVVDVRAVLAP